MTRYLNSALSLSLPLLLLSGAMALAQEAPKGLPAEVITLETRPLERHLEAVGSLRANEAATISPEQTGRISGIHFTEGSPINLGDKLFTLEASTYVAELRQVEASRELSQVEYDQAENLLNRKLGSKHARDTALAQLEIDRARVNLARTRLDKMTLHAPFSGNLDLRSVSIGDYVQAGDPLVELVDLSSIKADFRVPEIYLGQVRIGQTVEVRVDAFPEQQFSGEIYALSPQLDERGRSLQMRARIENPDGTLRPGLFARIRLLLERKETALMAPEEAILPQGKQFFVYKVVDNKVEKVAVQLGQRQRGQVEVLSGLSAGEVVVTAGQMKLRPGSPLTPIFADEQTGQRGKPL